MFRFQNVVFWFYGLVICLLGCWLWHLRLENNRQRGQYPEISKTIVAAQKLVERSTERNRYKIYKQSDAYRSPHFQKMRQQADSLQKLWDSLPPFSLQKRLDFADRLRRFCAADEQTLASLDLVSSKERIAAAETSLACSRAEQRLPLLEILRLNHAVATHHAMSFLESQTRMSDIRLDQILPMLVLANPCPRVGDMLRGKAFAVPFSSVANNLTFFLNGEKLPVEQGRGKFKTVFPAAGLQNLEANISLKNPLTEEVRVYSSTFSNTVCQ